MQEDYSNREIDTLITEVKHQLDRIEAQTTKTNGRVNGLENWRSYLVGAWFVITAFVIPLVLFLSSSERKTLELQINANQAKLEELTRQIQK